MTTLEECNHNWVDLTTMSDKHRVAKCVKCLAVRHGNFTDEPEELPVEDRDGAFVMMGYLLVTTAVVFSVIIVIAILKAIAE